MKIDGSCHCGFIKYQAEVDPEGVYVCHCTDCQSISGGAFRWAVSVPETDFKLLAGTPKTYVKTSESGAPSHQLFLSRMRLATLFDRDRQGAKNF